MTEPWHGILALLEDAEDAVWPLEGEEGVQKPLVSSSDAQRPEMTRKRRVYKKTHSRRQYEQRVEAEKENSRLRLAIDEHNQLIDELKRAIHRAITERRPKPFFVGHPFHTHGQWDPHSDPALRDRLQQKTFSIYQQLALSAGKPTRQRDFQDVSYRYVQLPNSVQVIAASFIQGFLAPFEYHRAANAIWASQSGEYDADMLAAGFDTSLNTPEGPLRFRGILAGRRYREVDRDVIILTAELHPIQSSDFDGSFTLDARITVQKLPSHPPTRLRLLLFTKW
ncbi:hypothetical protein Poli38472_004963 [Pythium oligandrum]|uniref:Uncharacterized protein n=1 Tax=Pythium oligandrum TaxID=41045 RepID=A0A8K1FGD3_PYTOL|nr:hypothetical protein Poli38472_004963 [Pythium oligandrum]|eukprot:TMW59894.1 hypothetical protein Poli38472_004963 [Pythium oligandrum]